MQVLKMQVQILGRGGNR